MNDPLKEYIRQNRSAFDNRLPSDNVWSSIASSLPETKPYSLWNSLLVWRVAAVVFLSVSIYLFSTRSSVPAGKKSEVAKMQNEFTDQELFYNDQIAEKVAFIDDFANADEQDQFTQDFQKLDAMYQVLREEMRAKPSEKVRDALILNMLIRIDLLNQQIKRLEDSGKKAKPKEATI